MRATVGPALDDSTLSGLDVDYQGRRPPIDGHDGTLTDSEAATSTPTGEDTRTDCDGDPTDAPDGQDTGTATQVPTNGTQSTDVGEGSPGNEMGTGDAAGGTDDDGVGAGLVVTAVAVLAAARLGRR